MERELNAEPENLELIELLGDTYSHQMKWKKARTQYKKLVKEKPNSAKYHYKYGGVLGLMAKEVNKLRALGMLGEISRHLRKAAELDKNHVEVRWTLVELYMQLPGIVGGSKRKALKYAEQLQGISKVEGYLAKGYIYEYEDEPRKAEMYYTMAINSGRGINALENKSKPKRNALNYQIGKVAAQYNLQLIKGEQSLYTYIENISVQDGVPVEWAYLRLAQIYKHKKEKTQALNWIDKALSVRSDFKQALEEKRNITSI